MSSLRRPAHTPVITVIGIGAQGWSSVPEPLREKIVRARTLLGGRRHLEMLPTHRTDQARIPWPSPLRERLPDLLASLDDGPVVALASGDPLVSGIGSTLIDLLGADRVRIHPAVSSLSLARAEMGWAAESCAVVSLVGRHPARILREAAPGRRVLVLSADETTPAAVAELLTEAGWGASHLHVLGNLGAEDFARTYGVAAHWMGRAPRLNIIAVQMMAASAPGQISQSSWATGLPDSAYEHDGQLTKRDLRASALARLAPVPGEHLWDIGAGAGSIGIEWMRSHPTSTATAIEARADRAERISRNAGRLGVPDLRVVVGSAPEALADLPSPRAVFIGGGATVETVQRCFAAMPVGGRLVVHAVTLETEHLLGRLHAQHGGELTRVSVETASPIGSYTGWKPARTVTQWFLMRGHTSDL